jgi:hypothetical protein
MRKSTRATAISSSFRRHHLWWTFFFFFLTTHDGGGGVTRSLAFSVPAGPGAGSGNNNKNSNNLGVALDRFQSTCPADPSCIQQFDPELVVVVADGEEQQQQHGSVWAAVYRSNQNQPSVFVRDEFFHAMNAATTMGGDDGSASKSSSTASWADKLQTPMALEKPVAVAQLRRSPDFKREIWVLDSLRCALKKENVDDNCDGGSEFLEALSVAIDSLVLYHLNEQHRGATTRDKDDDDDEESSSSSTIGIPSFEGAIRTKGTLFSNRLMEDRGFRPVETLSKDMATHISSLDSCSEKYAERSVDTSLNLGARDRALQIVSLLAQVDRSNTENTMNGNDDDTDEDERFDPWANIKMQL